MRALAYLALCITLGLVSPADSRPRAYSAVPGPEGPVGPQGAQGPQGDLGAQGVPGPRGAKGEKGDAGPQGPAGPAGARGDAGAAGPKGETGQAGSKGDQGAPGSPGAAGVAGAAGPAGAAGKDGAAGANGKDGAAGPIGPAGPQGPKSSTFVCNATLAETAVSLLGSGLRVTPETTCSGVLTTDLLEVYPTTLASLGGTGTATQGYAANYAVHHAFPTSAGKMRALISFPGFLALGSAYSIPVAVYAVNR